METWENPNYRITSPAETRLHIIRPHLERVGAKSIVDIGTGCGRIAYTLSNMDGYKVTPVDIAANCMDEQPAKHFKGELVVTNLFSPDFAATVGSHDYGICIDVLEHLPPEGLDAALSNIKAVAEHGCLVPACFRSGFKGHYGPLHLIVESPGWWKDKISEYFPDAEFVLESSYCVARF